MSLDTLGSAGTSPSQFHGCRDSFAPLDRIQPVRNEFSGGLKSTLRNDRSSIEIGLSERGTLPYHILVRAGAMRALRLVLNHFEWRRCFAKCGPGNDHMMHFAKVLFRPFQNAFARTRAARRRGQHQNLLPQAAEQLESRCLLSATATSLGTFANADELQTFLLGDLQAEYAKQFGQPRESSYRIYKPGFTPIYQPTVLVDYLSTNASIDSASLSTTVSDTASRAPEASGTNNQVEGVDEADQLKSDGNFIYFLNGSDLLIVRSWPVEDMEVVSRTPLSGKPLVQFLNGDRLMVVTVPQDVANRHATVQVTVFDIADRSHPQVVDESRVDGSFVRALMIGDQVQLVVNNSINTSRLWNPYSYYDSYPYAQLVIRTDAIFFPGNPRDTRFDPLQTTVKTTTETEEYTEHKTVTTFESWDDYRTRVLDHIDLLAERLPGVYRHGTSLVDWTRTGFLSNPDDIVRPPNHNYDGTLISVATFHLAGSTPATIVDTASVFGGSQSVVYQSQDHLYVTDTEYDNGLGKTMIHQFLVEPTQISATAVGSVPGYQLNQFSMDEYAGHFRIVTNVTTQSSTSWWWQIPVRTSSLYVLQTDGTALNVVGQVDKLASGEEIKSARFVGDRAYLVTFRRTDPLFVFDLSDATNPQVLGELVIPGFSEYLQPIDADHIIGIGQSGQWGIPQVSLFDVSHGHTPTLVSRQDVIGNWSYSDTNGSWQLDSHAVSYFADEGILAIPVNKPWFSYWGGISALENRLLVLHVDATGIQKLGEIIHSHAVLRNLRIGDGLYSITDNTIKVNALTDPNTELAELSLDQHTPWHTMTMYTQPLTPNGGFGSHLQDLFDENYYAQAYPDVAESVAGGGFSSGFAHYLKYGVHEGRNPNAFFDEKYYMASNTDVRDAVHSGGFASGFEHFVKYGQFEMRSPGGNFNDHFYLGKYADVRTAVLSGGLTSGFAHMVEYGQHEGRSPHAFYDEQTYLQSNPDVAAAVSEGTFQTGLQHYLQYGEHEGRRASAFFDEKYYLQQNPDVAAAVKSGAFDSGIEHYLQYGRREGRFMPLTYSEISNLDAVFADHHWAYDLFSR